MSGQAAKLHIRAPPPRENIGQRYQEERVADGSGEAGKIEAAQPVDV